ncbi:restriction endonuclease subunit S [Alienimonas sp. DA493]|uniref:restriction endonuclease subunit S n=1 Tax=Alienimonas sp. DA493 TaxID=3373605 RepID=UPI003754B616
MDTPGVPVIRGTNMGKGRFVSGDFAFVSESKAADLSSNVALPGDLVFTQRGTLGQVALVPDGPFAKYIVSQSQMKITVDTAVADRLYLFYLFSSAEQQHYIRQNAIQTGVPHTNLGILKKTPVLLPPPSEQRAIAGVLGALDDKIELNRRMNRTLEATARALFQSWFVDFDPVHANAAGAPTLPPDLAALFPAEFDSFEIGDVPKGWEVSTFDRVAAFERDTVKPMEAAEETFDHYSLPAFDAGRMPQHDLGGTIKSNKYAVPPDAVLISRLNPRIPRVWMPNLGDQRRSICSTEFLVARPRPKMSREWLYGLLTSDRFQRRYQSMVTGTTGSHQRVKAKSLPTLPQLIPPPSIVEVFTRYVAPMYARISANGDQSRTLAALRDALLPKLLSGDLSVAAVQRAVDA